MATTEIKVLTLTGLSSYDEKIKAKIATDDAATLAAAKSYADGLADNYDAAGTATTKVNELANGQVATNTAAIETLNGNSTTVGSVAKAVSDAKAEVEEKIGDLDILQTAAKDDLVNAINEVRNSVSAGGTAAAITIDTTTTTAGYLKTYTVKQGDNIVGTIDIPKDMFVESGSVVTVNESEATESTPAGTYIKLVLANVADPLYVNVGTLVDIYKAKDGAAQIQIAIDSATREISATVVAGSITATEIAANAITTEKIADSNVTLAKLSTSVQSSIGKADTAVQSITSGTANGSIAVDGVDVAVNGLGSAAYTASTAYDSAGSASAVLGSNTDVAGTATVYGALASTSALEQRVGTLESTTYTSITEDEIGALFA